MLKYRPYYNHHQLRIEVSEMLISISNSAPAISILIILIVVFLVAVITALVPTEVIEHVLKFGKRSHGPHKIGLFAHELL